MILAIVKKIESVSKCQAAGILAIVKKIESVSQCQAAGSQHKGIEHLQLLINTGIHLNVRYFFEIFLKIYLNKKNKKTCDTSYIHIIIDNERPEPKEIFAGTQLENAPFTMLQGLVRNVA